MIETQYATSQMLLKLSYMILIMTHNFKKWTLHLQEWPLYLKIRVMMEVQHRSYKF